MFQERALDLLSIKKTDLGITSVQPRTRFEERTTVSDAQQKLCKICVRR